MRKVCLVLLFSVLFNSISFAQTNRGVGIKVKDRSGKEREVKLYDASYALIIGNSNYKFWDVLNGVKSDVATVEKALKENGFQVETAMDLDSRSLSPRIEQFVRDHGYEENNRLLIYYAGHGYTQKSVSDDRELGYIVPIDSPSPTKDRVGFLRTAVDLEEIRTFAKKIQSKHALFLFDSCFSGKLVSRGEIAVPPIIEESISYPVRQFITAGAANQTVPDESIFRRAFIRGLEGEADLNKDGFILGSELASYLRDRVTNYSSRKQTPLYAKIDDINLDRGDFVFEIPKHLPSIVIESIAVQNQPTPQVKPSPSPNVSVAQEKSDSSIELKKDREEENYGYIYSFKDINDNYGFKDENGKVVVYPQFSSIGEFNEGLIFVCKNLKCGYLKSNGVLITELIYDWIPYSKYNEGLARVRLNGKSGYLDEDGKVRIPFKFDGAGDFGEGLASVSIKNKEFYIDKTGNIIISLPNKFYGIDGFSEGFGVVGKGGKYGYIDRDGNIKIPLQYSQALPFKDGLAVVEVGADKDGLNGKRGYIDKSGKVVIPFQFDYAGEFSEGLAWVAVGGPFKKGYIDKTGKIVIPVQFSFAESFKNGKAWVNKDGRGFYIDKNGNEIK